MQLTLPIIALSLLWSLVADAKPSRTYFLKVSGNKEMANRLVEELSKQVCFTLGDLNQTPQEETDECHAFRKFKNAAQIKGNLKKPGSTFLYKVAIDSPKKFNLQIYQRDDKKLRRILNAGDFEPEEDFFAKLTKTAIGLTFK